MRKCPEMKRCMMSAETEKAPDLGRVPFLSAESRSASALTAVVRILGKRSRTVG